LPHGRSNGLHLFCVHGWKAYPGSVVAHPVGEVLRGDEIGAVLFHDSDSILVNVRTVLDGIHASLCGPSDALRAVGVRSHFAPETMRVGHDGLQFF
jgi:hypothetical protein